VNFQPIIFGAVTFIIIGMFHPIVIKAEYYFSYRIWPLFAVIGTALLVSTLFMVDFPRILIERIRSRI